MSKLQQDFIVKAAGGDPGLICPAAGYIPNPLTESKGWYKIAEFQTNSPSTTTFDPVITASSGQFAWDLGNGDISMYNLAPVITYADSSIKTVKLFGKGTCIITSIDLNNDNIVGTVDLSNSAFNSLTSIYFQTNLLLTNFVAPVANNANILALSMYSTGLTSLDLSIFSKFASSAIIYLHQNSSLQSLIFAASITGTISNLTIYSTGLIGVLNVSMFTAFIAAGAYFDLYSNPAITSIIFGSNILGTFKTIRCYDTPGCFSPLAFATPMNIASSFVGANNKGWSAAQVNQFLHEINTLVSSGISGRSINISGTNAAPDRSSGGYDGIAEKAAIVAKGIFVTATLAVPTLAATTAASGITQTTATSGGNVTNEQGAYVTAKGVCWSTSQNPTIANSKTTDGTGPGSFTSAITGLAANTTYYVRAYATNSVGTAYGVQISFKTLP